MEYYICLNILLRVGISSLCNTMSDAILACPDRSPTWAGLSGPESPERLLHLTVARAPGTASGQGLNPGPIPGSEGAYCAGGWAAVAGTRRGAGCPCRSPSDHQI